VLGAWPRLSTLNPVWFTVALAAELASFTCNFALQRLALHTKEWFPVVTAGLTGNAVSNSLPGGSAAGAAVQFHMLTTAGFDTDTAVGGLTAFSLIGVGGLLMLPLLALPAILAGVPVSRGLANTALLGIAAFVLYAVFGVIVLRADWPLATLGRVAQRLWKPRIDSSTSMLARLRNNIAVGRRLVSPKDITGNSNGTPPACHTPSFTFWASSLKCALQGVSSEKVLQIPMIGRPSNASSVRPRIQLR
jgi:uncharacterized membrane protein YbhN (UPF0104 family)